MARSETTAPAARQATAPERRVALARQVLDLLRRALPADTPLELTLAGDAGAEPPHTPARIVVGGPDALARLLWPPSADVLGEAYLRGDIDFEGDIWIAVDAGRAFSLRRLGRALPRLARLGLELRRGAAPAPRLKKVARLSGRRHSRARDLAAVRFHYDVGNDFFALWLDRRLVYSRAYFETPRDIDRHGIATPVRDGPLRRRWLRFRDGGFLGRYVFPDGELVSVEDAAGFARRAGFELLDAQSLRPHYALTLRAWVERLEASANEARAMVGEDVYRTWRLYMAAARGGFEDGSLDAAQLLLARPGPQGPAELPLRPWWPA